MIAQGDGRDGSKRMLAGCSHGRCEFQQEPCSIDLSRLTAQGADAGPAVAAKMLVVHRRVKAQTNREQISVAPARRLIELSFHSAPVRANFIPVLSRHVSNENQDRSNYGASIVVGDVGHGELHFG